MTSAQAIIGGAFLIATSIVFAISIRPAEAQRLVTGPFQLMHHSNPLANAGVFRLDTSSGEVTYCYVTATSELSCTRAVK